MISRHRTRVEKGGIGYTDNPTVGGFGPSLPMVYDALDAADMEAAWLGNVMKHCVNMGAIPPLKLDAFHTEGHLNTDHTQSAWWGRTFWWVNGRCKGLSGGRSENDTFGFFGKVSDGWGKDIDAIVSHLRTWAPSVLRAEGVEVFIYEGERIRDYSMRCFPAENDEWLTIDEAAGKYGRSWQTIRNWVKSNTVEYLGVGKDALIKDNSLKFRIDAIQSNVAENVDRTNNIRWS